MKKVKLILSVYLLLFIGLLEIAQAQVNRKTYVVTEADAINAFEKPNNEERYFPNTAFGKYEISTEPILTNVPNTWESVLVGDPYIVVSDSGDYYMYYWGGHSNTAIGLATSKDLVSWTKYPSNPIFTKSLNGWDNSMTGKPYVIKAGNTWYMYYIGNSVSDAKGKIGLATSTNMINWTRYNTTGLILSPGAESLEDTTIGYTAVSVYNEKGTFYMYLMGERKGDYTHRIYYATSTDGINFTRKGLCMDVSSSGWDDGWIAPGSIIKDGKYYVMSYNGGNETPTALELEPNPSGIGLAYSTDLKNWTKYSGNPVIESDTNRTYAKYIWRSHINKVGNDFWIFLNAGDGLAGSGIERIFVAKQSKFDSYLNNAEIEKNLFHYGDTLNISNGHLLGNSSGHFKIGDISAFEAINSDSWGYNPSVSIYKAKQDWWASFALRTQIDSTNFNQGGYGNTHILGLVSDNYLKIPSGTQSNTVESIRGQTFLNLTGSAAITDTWRNGGVTSLSGQVIFSTNSAGTISNINGCRTWIYPAGSHTTTVTNLFGFQSVIEKNANSTYINAYGFYSQFPNSMGSTNVYHFYGLGVFPSWFGGSVNAMGFNYAADAQANDSYQITLKGAHTLTAGLEVTFKANTANTGAATLQVNSLTTKNLTKASAGSVATALATGDIIAGQIVKAVYDGTQFQIISRLAQ